MRAAVLLVAAAWDGWREAGGLLWPSVRRNEAGRWAYLLDGFEATG